MGNNETLQLQEYFSNFESLLWNRNSKHTAEEAIPAREAVSRLVLYALWNDCI